MSGVKLIAEKCPVCNGIGIVPNGFYSTTSPYYSSTSTIPDKCRSCNGTGVVWYYSLELLIF